MTEPVRLLSSLPDVSTLPSTESVEARIAEAVVQLEDSSARSRDAARAARRLRREAQRDRIDHLRGAAIGNLVVGLVRPAVDLAGTALSAAETRSAASQVTSKPGGAQSPSFGEIHRGHSEATSGAVEGAQALGRFFTQRIERRAESDGAVSEAHGDRASSLDDAADTTDRLRDRALSHLDDVSRSRWQARLALARF